MPGPDTQPLFDEARRLGVGFCLGYAELTDRTAGMRHRFNTQILVERDGSVVARYRKVHLPGHEEHEPDRPFQHAERYFFEPGPEGFGVWRSFGGNVGMMICNDRRWPESYRVMGLQGVELILCGYNTPIHYAPDPSQDVLQGFHNALVMQSGAYQNGTWVVGVAKGGVEEGVDSLAQSMIVAPSGQIVAQALTAGDELVTARCDLDWCARYQGTVFDFDRYRRPGCIRDTAHGAPRRRTSGLHLAGVPADGRGRRSRRRPVRGRRWGRTCGHLDLDERGVREGGHEARREVEREVRVGGPPHDAHRAGEAPEAGADGDEVVAVDGLGEPHDIVANPLVGAQWLDPGRGHGCVEPASEGAVAEGAVAEACGAHGLGRRSHGRGV